MRRLLACLLLTLPAFGAELLAEIDGIVEGMNAAGIAATREDLVAI